MKFVLAGASGFLGTALVEHLRDEGHEVVRLVRSDPTGPDQRRWDPAAGELDPAHLDGADAVFNLGGVPIARWPWTRSYREQIVSSRLEPTGTLAETIADLDAKPALVSTSGVNVYGFDRGDEKIDETSETGPASSPTYAGVGGRDSPAADAGARVAIMRSAPVLHRSGRVLKLAKLPFRLGLGGRLGGGQQWFPSISLRDYLAAATRCWRPIRAVRGVQPGRAGAGDERRLHRGDGAPPEAADRDPGARLRAEDRGGRAGRDAARQPAHHPERLLAAGFSLRRPDRPGRRSTSPSPPWERSWMVAIRQPELGVHERDHVPGRPVVGQRVTMSVGAGDLHRQQPVDHGQPYPAGSAATTWTCQYANRVGPTSYPRLR